MSNFKILALEDNFDALFQLSNEELNKRGMQRTTVSKYPGTPCRISLQDAPIGEEVILLPHEHHQTGSPYRASGPIFIRKHVQAAALSENEIPKMLNHRLLSVRAYDAHGFMIEATVCEGAELRSTINGLFSDQAIMYLHIHNARPGCYNCKVIRA